MAADIQSGWAGKKLSHCATFTMGYAFSSSDFVPSGVPLIRMGNLYQNKLDLERHTVFLPNRFVNAYSKYCLYAGDLVLSMTGTVGKRDYGFVVEMPEMTPACLLNQRVVKIDPKHGLSKGFLFHVMRSDQFLDQLYRLPGGTKQANLSTRQLGNIQIPIPPLAEQRKIAAILSTWDAAITLTHQLIAALQRRKQALMQLLLTGAVRLPEFDDEWEEVALEDIAQINPAKPIGIPDDDVVSFIGMADVSEEARLIDAANRKYAEVKNGFTGFQDRDVLIAKITPCFENGKGALVDNLANGVGFGSTEFHVARANSELATPGFIYYQTVTHRFRGKGEANMSGSASQKRVPTEFVRSYRVRLPPLNEQQKITDVLKASDFELDTLQGMIVQLNAQKRGLMQQLLTGSVRVPIIQ